MIVPSRRSSRRLAAILAAAAFLALVVCVVVDVRCRPSGQMRLVLWGGGLVVYGILLKRAIGPVIDWRDRDDRNR